jgi:hypothetical protein
MVARSRRPPHPLAALDGKDRPRKIEALRLPRRAAERQYLNQLRRCCSSSRTYRGKIDGPEGSACTPLLAPVGSLLSLGVAAAAFAVTIEYALDRAPTRSSRATGSRTAARARARACFRSCSSENRSTVKGDARATGDLRASAFFKH